MSCLPISNELEINQYELLHKKNLRNNRNRHNILSIDPIGCQDIDDAMHVFADKKNNTIELGVHIDDVTYYVKQNTSSDEEAKLRSNTLYFIEKRYDMLPSQLSSNLCSLLGNKDRHAVSIIWTLSKDLKTVIDAWYGRAIIHNYYALT